jgi:hypothetical protein
MVEKLLNVSYLTHKFHPAGFGNLSDCWCKLLELMPYMSGE